MGCLACRKRTHSMRGTLFILRGLSGGSSWRELARALEKNTNFPHAAELQTLVRKLDDRDLLFPGISWQDDVDLFRG
jgi:hypothetical protein